MKKFQVLFAMLFVALTFSLTSCSDDATSAPASPFTKSATQPDSYMPLNQANTWTYTTETKITKNGQTTTDKSEFTMMLKSSNYSDLESYVASGQNVQMDYFSTMTLTYQKGNTLNEVLSNINGNDFTLGVARSNDEIVGSIGSVTVNNTNYPAYVLTHQRSTQYEGQTDSRTHTFYYVQGLGLVKYTAIFNEYGEEINFTATLKSCSLK